MMVEKGVLTWQQLGYEALPAYLVDCIHKINSLRKQHTPKK